MNRSRRAGYLGLVVAMMALGCGGSSSSGSGVPVTAKLTDLTNPQILAVCDYVNNVQGGYDKHQTCSDGTTGDTDTSQESCATSFLPGIASQCPTLTVGDVEGCARSAGTDLCSLGSKARLRGRSDLPRHLGRPRKGAVEAAARS